MHCPVGSVVDWWMRLTPRDSSLSGQKPSSSGGGQCHSKYVRGPGKSSRERAELCFPIRLYSWWEAEPNLYPSVSSAASHPKHKKRASRSVRRNEKAGSKSNAADWMTLPQLDIFLFSSNLENTARTFRKICCDESGRLALVLQWQFFFLISPYNFKKDASRTHWE